MEAESHLRSVKKRLANAVESVVTLFYRQGNYLCYDKDADAIAKQLGTPTGIKEVGKGGLKMKCHVVSPMLLEGVLRGLVCKSGLSVEILTPASGGQWERTHRVTPGNTEAIEEMFGSDGLSGDVATSMAVKTGTVDGVKMVGVAFCDRMSSTIYVRQFHDTSHLTTFESILVQVPNIRECLAPSPAYPEQQLVAEIVGRAGVVFSELPAKAFQTKDVEQDVGRLTRKDLTSYLPLLKLKLAMAAVSALLSHLELLGDDRNFGLFRMEDLKLDQFMRLDAAAIEALQLLPTSKDTNKSMCLNGILDKCVTKAGSRRLRAWICQPLLAVDAITERQDVVAAFLESPSLRDCLRTEYLKVVPDISRIIYRLQRGRANLEDCCKLHSFFMKIPGFVAELKGYTGKYTAVRTKFTSVLETYESAFLTFVELVEAVVDMEEAETHNYIVKPAYDPELEQLYKEMTALELEMELHAEKVRSKLDAYVKRGVEMQRYPSVGFAFRVTRADEKGLRKCTSLKYHTVETRKDGVKFRTAALKQLDDSYEEGREQYEKKQKVLVEQVMTTVMSYMEPFMVVSELVAEMDVLAGWAEVFATYPAGSFVRPVIYAMGSRKDSTDEKKGSITLVQARHPCLEMQEGLASALPASRAGRTHVMGQVVPNDVSLTRDDASFQIITGPNMGGKSTYIRSAGIVVLMAQIGCMVPCQEAYVTCVDAILCRVGAGDCLARGMSTFMAEMVETSSILDTATGDSLVIIDELGRGTSTYDGFGLAWAISEHLCKTIQPFCFFATHFHELTLLEKEVPCVKNLRVAAESKDSELVLLYKVEPEPCDRSFGIHVAKLANFPQSVIEVAKRKAAELENFSRDGSTAATDLLGSEPPKKRQKTREEEEGDALIDAVMKDVADGGGHLDAAGLKAFKEKVEAGMSPYIKHVLENFA